MSGESVLEGFEFDFSPTWEMLDRADEVAAAATLAEAIVGG